jgi:competence protein ComEC
VNRPFVVIGLGWIAGSLLCHVWVQPLFFWICVGIGSFGIGSWLYYWQRKGLLLSLFVLGLAVGAARFTFVEENNHSQIAQWVQGASVQAAVRGRIDSAPQVDGDRLLFCLRVEQLQGEGVAKSIPHERIQVSVHLRNEQEWGQAQRWERGFQVEMPLILERPPPARNPGGFDYRAYLYRQQIHWSSRVEGLEKIQVLSSSSVDVRVWVDRWRKCLGEKITHLYTKDQAGLMRAMLLGERKELDEETAQEYQELGIIHLLSISGYNVGIFVIGLYWILRRLRLTKEKAAGLMLPFLLLYVLLTGAEAPVVRAALMAGMACIAVVGRRFQDTLSFMALSLLIQLWWNPYQWMEAGFQLSYLITAALLVMVPPLVERLPFGWYWIRQAIVVTVVAQIISFPILIWHFHQFSFISWLANLFVVPIISLLIVPVGTLALLVSLLSEWVGTGLARFSSFWLQIVDIGVDWLLQFAWADRSWVSPHGGWILVYGLLVYFTWVSWIAGRLYERRFRYLTSCSLLLWLVLAQQWPQWVRDETRLTFLDVGQGDAAVIETRGGKVILIDGGGTFSFPKKEWQIRKIPYDVGKKVLVPYLQSRGIQQIDTIVITHGDADHIEGLQAVAEQFSVKQVIHNPHPPASPIEAKLLQTWVDRQTEMLTVPQGTAWELEQGVKWQFLHPDEKHLLGKTRKLNDDGIVVLLSIYGYSILMTGDIEASAEDQILQTCHLSKVHLLKVAHHGSRTSTQARWLQVVQPQIAVISVGKKNRYGHPTPEVLQRLHQFGAQVMRTDEQGAITFHIKPGKMWAETMIQPDKE